MTLGLATSCVLACVGGSVKTFGWVMFGARSVQALFTWVLVVLCVGVLFVCFWLLLLFVCCCCVLLLLLFCCCFVCLLLFGGGDHRNCILTHLGL